MDKKMMTYLNVRHVAQMLNRSEAAVRQMCWRRQLPYRKVKRRLVFRSDEIEELIEQDFLQAPGISLSEVVGRG